jgi:hypothetical protein
VKLPPGRRQPAETCRPQPLQSQSIAGNKFPQLCESGVGTVHPLGRLQPAETCRLQSLTTKICRGEKYPIEDGAVLPNHFGRLQPPTVRPRGRRQPLRSTSCDGNKTPQLLTLGVVLPSNEPVNGIFAHIAEPTLVTRIPSSVTLGMVLYSRMGDCSQLKHADLSLLVPGYPYRSSVTRIPSVTLGWYSIAKMADCAATGPTQPIRNERRKEENSNKTPTKLSSGTTGPFPITKVSGHRTVTFHPRHEYAAHCRTTLWAAYSVASWLTCRWRSRVEYHRNSVGYWTTSR